MKRIIVAGLLLLLSACASNSGQRFVILEKTAVDQATGVVWMKNANLPETPLLWKGDDNVYAFIQRLNSELYAGYADWRVPSKAEMNSLIDYAKSFDYDPKKMETWPYQNLKRAGFQDVRDYGYWTTTRHSQSELWIADFASGQIMAKPDDKPYYLWPVRGGRD